MTLGHMYRFGFMPCAEQLEALKTSLLQSIDATKVNSMLVPALGIPRSKPGGFFWKKPPGFDLAMEWERSTLHPSF